MDGYAVGFDDVKEADDRSAVFGLSGSYKLRPWASVYVPLFTISYGTWLFVTLRLGRLGPGDVRQLFLNQQSGRFSHKHQVENFREIDIGEGAVL